MMGFCSRGGNLLGAGAGTGPGTGASESASAAEAMALRPGARVSAGASVDAAAAADKSDEKVDTTHSFDDHYVRKINGITADFHYARSSSINAEFQYFICSAFS